MGTSLNQLIDSIILLSLRRQKKNFKRIFMEPEHKETISETRQTSNMEDGYKKDILVTDFQQCMYMLRHYDTINWDLSKFCFGQIIVVIGACWTILNRERGSEQTLWDVYSNGTSNYIVGGVLLLSACFVFLTLIAIARNRTYFVLMGRYLNEHRQNVTKNNSLGFENKSKMWVNPTFPVILDWKSTQMVCIILFSLCFILLLFISLYSLFLKIPCGICWSILVTFISSIFGFIILRMMLE